MYDHTAYWQKIRESYPLLEKGTYLKNASIAAMHHDVRDEIKKWNDIIAEEAGIHEERYFELLMDVHTKVSQFLSCDRDDITLLENSSHNMNILAMMLARDKREGRNEIIAIADEFPSNILPFYHHGFKVIQVESQHGHFKAQDLFDRVNQKTAAVVCSVVQFSSGHYTDPRELSLLAEQAAVPLFLNTTQSLGVIPLSLKELNISALTSSCHKWLGSGIGASLLYLSKEFREKRPYPMAGWCSVENPFEMRNEKPTPRSDVMALQLGSLPFPVLAGVAQSCQVISQIGQDSIYERILKHSHFLREKLQERGIKTLGNGLSGITTFALHQNPQKAADFVESLKEKRIYVNCRRGLIRASPSFYNTREELEHFLASLP